MMSVGADIPDMGSQSTESWLKGSGKGEKEINLKGKSCKGTLVVSTNGTAEIKKINNKKLKSSTLDTNNVINNVK